MPDGVRFLEQSNGYDKQQVDDYISKLIFEYQSRCDEYLALETKYDDLHKAYLRAMSDYNSLAELIGETNPAAVTPVANSCDFQKNTAAESLINAWMPGDISNDFEHKPFVSPTVDHNALKNVAVKSDRDESLSAKSDSNAAGYEPVTNEDNLYGANSYLANMPKGEEFEKLLKQRGIPFSETRPPQSFTPDSDKPRRNVKPQYPETRHKPRPSLYPTNPAAQNKAPAYSEPRELTEARPPAETQPLAETQRFIEAPRPLESQPSIKKAPPPLEARPSIEAPRPLETRSFIEAPRSLESQSFIEAPRSLDTRPFIEAPPPLETRPFIEAPQPLESQPFIEVPPRPLESRPFTEMSKPAETPPWLTEPYTRQYSDERPIQKQTQNSTILSVVKNLVNSKHRGK
ncbi:MAG: hypothetical protein LBB94_10450 [Clostridiales bacterium]|nr:hypothetical protein [Clostridiales bacterium]